MGNLDAAATAFAISVISMGASVIALWFSRKQTRTAEAALALAAQVEAARGALASVRLRWSRARGRVVATLASGDTDVTVEGLDVTIVLRRPAERVLGWVWGVYDLHIFLTEDEAWLFFDNEYEDPPRRLATRDLWVIPMTPYRNLWLDAELQLELTLNVHTATGGVFSSDPFRVAGNALMRSPTPTRHQGRGGGFHGLSLAGVIEELCVSCPTAIGPLLNTLANVNAGRKLTPFRRLKIDPLWSWFLG